MHIHFAFNDSQIDDDAAHDLDSMINSNKNKFNISLIELYGHCDFVGNDSYNDRLSLERVAAAKNYLVIKGVETAVFSTTKGFGKRQPLNNNSTDEKRFLNRRVELVIFKNPITTVLISKDTLNPIIAKDPKQIGEIIRDSATKSGTRIILRNLNFIGARHVLLPSSYPTLVELLKVMQNNPALVIEIHGHVCCAPGFQEGYDIDSGNYDLSIQRARMVYNYLLENGISASRMTYKGFASRFKLFPLERNEDEQMQNRRVEIKVVSK